MQELSFDLVFTHITQNILLSSKNIFSIAYNFNLSSKFGHRSSKYIHSLSMVKCVSTTENSKPSGSPPSRFLSWNRPKLFS